MEEMAQKETELELEKKLYIQHKVNEEQTKLKLHQQKEIKEAIFSKPKRRRVVQKKTGIRKGNYRKSVTVYGKTQPRRERHNHAASSEITEIHNNALFR